MFLALICILLPAAFIFGSLYLWPSPRTFWYWFGVNVLIFAIYFSTLIFFSQAKFFSDPYGLKLLGYLYLSMFAHSVSSLGYASYQKFRTKKNL
jgi:hypothetical protein